METLGEKNHHYKYTFAKLLCTSSTYKLSNLCIWDCPIHAHPVHVQYTEQRYFGMQFCQIASLQIYANVFGSYYFWLINLPEQLIDQTFLLFEEMQQRKTKIMNCKHILACHSNWAVYKWYISRKNTILNTPVTLTYYTKYIRKQIMAIFLVLKWDTNHWVMRTTTIYTERVLQYFLNKEKSVFHT